MYVESSCSTLRNKSEKKNKLDRKSWQKPSKPADYNTAELKESNEDDVTPEYPFATVLDATYSALTQRNFTAPPKPVTQKKAQLAYRNITPIYNDKVALAAFNKIMTSMITLTHREVFSLLLELCMLIAEAIVPWWWPVNEIQAITDEKRRIFMS